MSDIIQDQKKRRKTIIVVIIGGLLMIGLLVYYISKSQQKYVPPPVPPKVDVVGKQDTAKDSFIKQTTTQVQEQDKQLKETNKQLQELMGKIDSIQKGGSPQTPPVPGQHKGYPPVPPPPPQSSGTTPGLQNAFAPPPPGGHAAPSPYGVRERQLTELIAIENGKVSKESKGGPSDGDKKPGGHSSEKGDQKGKGIVSAGSFVKAILMNGVDAPSGAKGKGSPYPVLLRISDLAQLPNRFRSDIKECFAIGEAYGELSSERANVRVNNLSCVNKNGQTVESPVSAYVVGEDGKLGLSGTVVTKQGAMLMRSMAAGFLQGVSQAFNQSATVLNVGTAGTTSVIDPTKTTQAGVGGGVSKATEELAKFYTDMAKEMFPVVEISAGRKCEIVFINKFNLSEVR